MSASPAAHPDVRTPTSNIAVTSALAVLVFLTVPVAGIRAQGLKGYFGHTVSCGVRTMKRKGRPTMARQPPATRRS